jgi:hypothetical protein
MGDFKSPRKAPGLRPGDVKAVNDMRNSFPGGAAGADARQNDRDLCVCRVTDYTDADLLAGLELYYQMIPGDQRQGTAGDIVAQLRDVRRRRAEGLCQVEDCHFVAKLDGRVCGYLQLFLDPAETFAFIGFLAVRASLSLGKQMAWVVLRMCQEIVRSAGADRQLGACNCAFVELDDPGRAADEKRRRRGTARIARFAAICRDCGGELRFLDFDYVQARLGLPADCPGPERPHLLGYISRAVPGCMDRETVCNVLRFIYTRLNPEGVYGGDAQKDALYRSYLNELCTRECARVPASVPLLSAHEVIARVH